MFTVFGKILSYTFGSTDSDDPQENEASLATDEDTSKEEERNFDGHVTHVFSSHGLIDNEVYFSFDQVLGGQRPNVSDAVNVRAVRHHKGGGWHAQQVSISEDWENQEEADIQDELAQPSQIVALVTYSSKQTGCVNDNLFYDLNTCDHADFIPYKGDWVKVQLAYKEFETTVTAIEALRVKDTDGVVSGVMRDHGYIDTEVFYTSNALADGFVPKKWDPVHYRAVESQQGQCTWRALSVEPSQTPHIANLKVLQGPLQKSFTAELLSDKAGITVSDPGRTDFGQVTMGTRRQLTVWVKNNGTQAHKFCRCHLTASGSQITIKDVKYLQGSSNMSCEVKGELILYPAMSFYVNLQLEARSQGQEKPLLIFTFEKFKIGRYVTVNVTDPMVDLMKSQSDAYVGGPRQGYSRYRASIDSKSSAWMVPGERPNRNKKTVQYPHRLPQYHVPDDMREIVLGHDDVLYYAPILAEKLNRENYREKLKHLLYLEEIQMDIDIREFDLHRVCLRYVGEYLGLVVPGLAEGRPSVLIGDKVILTDPADPDGPCFEGYVHETLKSEVLLKFNPEFQRSYNGKDFNVVFTFNRGPLRKCHRATEMAKGLGDNVLFPTQVSARPAQCLLQLTSHHRSNHTKSKQQTKPDSTTVLYNKRLNARQRSAVTRIVQGQGRPLPYILFGPPGTGKTVTVVEAILQVFTQLPHSRIIACTPSNSAADLITERLHASGVVKTGDLVRLNALQRSEETIAECIRPYCTVGDCIDLASRYRILVSTCVSAGVLYSLGIKAGHFTHVFIDEAGQATEPEAMISSCLVSQSDGQIILAGDPQQLGPVLRSKFAKEYGLERSLLERLIRTPLYERDESKFADHGSYDPLLVTKLVENYRSHKAILRLPSRLFYHDELQVRADQELTHTFTDWDSLPKKGVPLVFHGVRGEDMREGNSPSWFNAMESVQVVRYLQSILNTTNTHISCDDIGIITPYRKQVEKIRLLIEKLGMAKVKVGSVEEFQGQERQVIIISTVRSNEEMIGFDEKHTLGFLSNPKRFNVAITRAQALLVVIGNPYVLMQDKYWRCLIEHCVDEGVYVGCDLPPTAIDL